MKQVALFGAMYFELKPLLRRLKIVREIREKEFHLFESRWRGLRLYVVRTGVGKKNAERAARRMLEIATPSVGISFGLCGAVAHDLKVGQTVLSTEVLDLEAGKRFNFGDCFGASPLAMTGYNLSLRGGRRPPWQSPQSLIVTSDKVLGRDEKEKLLREISDARVCDMESSALAAVFSEKKIPFAALRTVSDRWDAEFPPPEILIQTNIWRQLKMLMVHYQYKFPVEFLRFLKLGLNCRRATQKNAREVLKFISFFC